MTTREQKVSIVENTGDFIVDGKLIPEASLTKAEKAALLKKAKKNKKQSLINEFTPGADGQTVNG